LQNFFTLYKTIVSSWLFYDASSIKPLLVASGAKGETIRIYQKYIFEGFLKAFGYEREKKS
jgi:hypothetical protein